MDNERNHSALSDEDKVRVALQVDHFIELIEKRTGITFSEVVGLVLWARERKDVSGKLSFYASISIIGVAVTAIGYGLLEGIKHILNGTTPGK